MREIMFILLIAAISGCQGMSVGTGVAYEFTDKSGQKHRVELQITIQKLKAREKEHEAGKIDMGEIKRDLQKLAAGAKKKIEISICDKQEKCIIIDGKRYDMKDKDDLRLAYKEVEQLAKGGK